MSASPCPANLWPIGAALRPRFQAVRSFKPSRRANVGVIQSYTSAQRGAARRRRVDGSRGAIALSTAYFQNGFLPSTDQRQSSRIVSSTRPRASQSAKKYKLPATKWSGPTPLNRTRPPALRTIEHSARLRAYIGYSGSGRSLGGGGSPSSCQSQ